MTTLRDYQIKAIADVREAWASGARRVVCVVPTGGGKTTIGAELAHDGQRVVWYAHRIELLEQAAARLRAEGHDVAIVSPRHNPDPRARVQVASLDTIVSRGQAPKADLVVLDESHHADADTYSEILHAYDDARHLGLTATPQRADGRGLAGHYDVLVTGATYSQLLRDGHLVTCRVRRPGEPLGSDLARDPVDEWCEYGERRPTFAFARSVKDAERFAAQMTERGIVSAAIDGTTHAAVRTETMLRFRAGEITVLWNVHVLTEGVDVPSASCCLLARGTSHASTYLQMVGRVLRPAPGKDFAVLLDMPGVSHVHGLPIADRAYSLTGKSIVTVGESLRCCPQCGACIESALTTCDMCGYVFPKRARKTPKIWDMELAWAIDEAGGDPAAVSDSAKRREWDRLVGLVTSREAWSVSFATREYEKMFGSKPPAEWLALIDAGVQAREYARLQAVCAAKGYKKGWAQYRFKATFGRWPGGRRA